jgi:hypothetical protein
MGGPWQYISQIYQMLSPMLAFHMPMKQVTCHAGVKFVYELCARTTYSLNNSTVKIYSDTSANKDNSFRNHIR